MRLLHKIYKSKHKDHIISALVIGICACTLIGLKISESKTFRQYSSYKIGYIANSGYDKSNDDVFEASSQDQEYYDSFIGLPASDLFDYLESSFWEILDGKDNYTIYQNENGSTITIHYNELQIIEVIDINEIE